MTDNRRGHCHDWFRKWKREHNFCGLRPQDAKEMDRYIEITEKIAGNGHGMDEDFIHDHFTAGAARPLLRCKDEAISTKALNYVVSCLKRGEDITGGDLSATIAGFQGKGASKPAGSTQLRTSEPAKIPPAPCTVPCKGDPSGASGPVNLGDEIRKREMEQAGRNQHVGHGSDVSVTPAEMIAPDHIRESPFRTAAEIKQKQDGGIAGEMFDEEGRKQRIEQLLEEAIGLMPDYTKRCAAAIFEHHKTGWKHPYANLIYHAVEALLEKETMSQVRK